MNEVQFRDIEDALTKGKFYGEQLFNAVSVPASASTSVTTPNIDWERVEAAAVYVNSDQSYDLYALYQYESTYDASTASMADTIASGAAATTASRRRYHSFTVPAARIIGFQIKNVGGAAATVSAWVLVRYKAKRSDD